MPEAKMFDLAAALADRYRLERELGQGGMATVYLAEDLKHHRRVALKVLRPELAAIVGAERFLKEIEVTANLQHPSILPLYDSGEAGPFLYYVMPYIEGETLRQKLAREKQLSLDETIGIATAVAGALEFAHRRGVIHRDIKPENILLQSGQALVADFGIALAVSHAGGDRLTETGLSLGTPHYMSPEQASGDRQLDARSDVYSLGCVVYEMLAGDPPHLGSTAQAIVAQILTEEPRPLHLRRHTTPPQVEAAVHRAIQKAPADRFASTAEFATALASPNPGPTEVLKPGAGARSPRNYLWRRGVLVAVLVVVAGAGWWAWRRGGRGTGIETESPSIAVLPFVDMSATKDQAYFGDGVAEEILNGLSQLKNLRVASRTSSFKLRDADMRTIGAQLGVGHVLEGSVRRQGDEVRITAQLIAVKDGFHLWSETFDRPMKDIFAIQDDISRAVVRELRVRLLGNEAPAPGRAGTTNVQAYNHYLTGRFEWNRRSATSLRAAIESFQAALKLDSNYVMAYVGLADAYVVLAGQGLARPAEVFPPAISATRRALALAPDLSEAHRVQAFILLYYDHALADAEREYRRALALDPNDAFAHYWYALLLATERRFDEAEPQVLAGLRSDSAAPQIGLGVAQVYLLKGDYPKALAQARRVAQSDPTFAPIRAQLAMIDLGLNQPGEALAQVEEAERLGRMSPALRALVLWRLGRKEEAQSLVARTEAERQSHYVEGWSLALYYSGIGDVENALRWMAAGVDERSTLMYFSSYLFAPPGGALRKDPRYRQLLERAGLDGVLDR